MSLLERLNRTYGKDKSKTPTPAQIERVIRPNKQTFINLEKEYPPTIQDIAKKVEKVRRRYHNRKQR